MFWNCAIALFRFCTGNILWLGSNAVPLPYNNLVRLEVSRFRFHTRCLTFNPPPHKEYSVTWSSAVSLPYKEYTMSWSSAVLLSHTEQSVTWSSAVLYNILWLEIPQFRFRKKKTSFEIPHFCFWTLLFHWKIHSHSTTHPFLNFRAVWHEWWTFWRQRNCSWQKSSLTFGLKLMTHYVHTSRAWPSSQVDLTLRPRERFIMLTHLRQRFWTATVSARRYGLSANLCDSSAKYQWPRRRLASSCHTISPLFLHIKNWSDIWNKLKQKQINKDIEWGMLETLTSKKGCTNLAKCEQNASAHHVKLWILLNTLLINMSDITAYSVTITATMRLDLKIYKKWLVITFG